jgi:hypothetical protein
MTRHLWTSASTSFSSLSSKTGLGIETLVPIDTLSVLLPLLLSRLLAALTLRLAGESGLHWVSSRCVSLTVADACPAGRGLPPVRPDVAVATRKRRWEGGICWFVRFSPLSLSRFLKRWAPGSGPWGCLVSSLGALWASGARGSRAGHPRAAAVFP